MLNSIYLWLCDVINVLLAAIFAIAMLAMIVIVLLGAYYLITSLISWFHEDDKNSEVADDDKRKIDG